ncbi:MAG: glycosyltransferase family 4 protein [Candidatus Eisenbacteria bacterium]
MKAPGGTILHLVDSGGVYGAEQVILNLASETARSARFEPLIGCIVRRAGEPNALLAAALARGLPAVRIPIRNARLPLDALAAGRRMRGRGVFLTHSHGYKPSVIAGILRAACGIEILATCHLWYPGAHPPLKYRIMTRLERRVYRRARAVVAVSEPIRERLIGWGVPADRVHVIANGIAVEQFAARDPASIERLRRALGLETGTKLILTVGRLEEQKNQPFMIEALGRVRRQGIDARLAIVGEGPGRAALEACIAREGLGGAVWLPGYRDDVAELMQAADIFALVSRDEGLPICLLEAMASRLPAVASPVGNVPALISSGSEGLLVGPDDLDACVAAFVHMLTDAEFARSCAARAFAKVQAHYSSAAMYGEYERLYALCDRSVSVR